MTPGRQRQQRYRERQRQAGMKLHELWLNAEGQDLVAALQQPGESLSSLVMRGLKVLQPVTSDRPSETGQVRQKPDKPRVDVSAYDRLMRFVRWMTPELSIEAVLRMFPGSDKWSGPMLTAVAQSLPEVLATELPPEPLATIVPFVVIGEKLSERYLPPLPVGLPSAPKGFIEFLSVIVWASPRPMLGDNPMYKLLGWPVFLDGRPPTIGGLCRLADDLRNTLHGLMDQGPREVYPRIHREIFGRVQIGLSYQEGRFHPW